MSKKPGVKYKTLWEDFMMMKATVLEQAFAAGEKQIFFFDSDICFMGPLPKPPASIKLGLSRHMIDPILEARYGHFNAGFIYTTDPNMPHRWRIASTTSRYYDQAALENLEADNTTHELLYFTIQNNYGWWRMSTHRSPNAKENWSKNLLLSTSGITVMDEPLLSVHTHWGGTKSTEVYDFNKFVYKQLCDLKSHPPAAAILKILDQEFPHLGGKN
jgi:hypothetical protein